MRLIFSRLLLAYLRGFAKIALRIHKPIVIGIAGSVGKSSTRNAIYALLKDTFPTKMVYGNSETGIPLGILGIDQHGFSYLDWLLTIIKSPFGIGYLTQTKYLIVEMGIDEPYAPKNMEYLLTIVKPHIAISLNVSATHTEQFEKVIRKSQSFSSDEEKLTFLIQAIANEDTKIITKSHCTVGIYNADNRHIKKSLQSFSAKETTLFTFGEKNNNTIYYDSYSVSLQGTVFRFTMDNKDIMLSFPYILPKEYQELFAAVILVGKYLNLSSKQITTSLEKNFKLPKGRGSIFSGIHHSLIIDSSYNASKDAVIAFLLLMQELKKQTKRPVVFLFGDMRELGEESRLEHEAVASALLPIVDYLYCIGPQTKKYVMPVLKEKENEIKEVVWFDNVIAAGEYLQSHLPNDALLLVKGSQNTLFLEEGIKVLLENKNDIVNLCRQEEYWLDSKRTYFSRIDTSLLNRKN